MAIPRIWIDTDIALGATRGDVDDGWALAAVAGAVRRGAAQLLGVSAVAGNTDAATAAQCARALLDVAGLESVPVLNSDSASAAITQLPTGTSLLALGPLTNVANAVRIDPTCSERLEVRIVSGVRHRLRAPLLALSDLNRNRDPRAAKLTSATHWRELRVLPLDVVRKLRIDAETLDRIAVTGALGKFLCQHSQRWHARTRWRYPLQRSFPAWDLVAALDALHRLPGAHWDKSSHMLTRFDSAAAMQKLLALVAD